MNIFNKIIAQCKRAWANPAIKATIVVAASAAFGAVYPMLAAGTFVLNGATVHAATSAAIPAVIALFIHKPQPFPSLPTVIPTLPAPTLRSGGSGYSGDTRTAAPDTKP